MISWVVKKSIFDQTHAISCAGRAEDSRKQPNPLNVWRK
jgi:hypothetical protein